MDRFVRSVLALSVVLALAAASGVGSARIEAQDPPGRPDPSPIGAQAIQGFAGLPAYSLMQTEGDTALGITPGGVDAFAAQPVPCPATAGANGCTIRITAHSQLWTDSGADFVVWEVAVSGPGLLGPAPGIGMTSNVDPLAEIRSMQWVKKNVPAGSTPTVTVRFRVGSGLAVAGYRTLSIDIFRGLL